MTSRKSLITILVIILSTFLISCNTNIKSPTEMTPQELSIFVMKLYNNAFDNYLIQYESAQRPLSNEMVEYFKAYKEVMNLAWPTISAYVLAVNSGSNPSPELENQLISVIYKLQSILIGGKK